MKVAKLVDGALIFVSDGSTKLVQKGVFWRTPEGKLITLKPINPWSAIPGKKGMKGPNPVLKALFDAGYRKADRSSMAYGSSGYKNPRSPHARAMYAPSKTEFYVVQRNGGKICYTRGPYSKDATARAYLTKLCNEGWTGLTIESGVYPTSRRNGSASGSSGSSSDVRSPTRTSTEVRSPTSTSTEVRSPTSTSTSTDAYTDGNVTVTGGAGDGATTSVSIYPSGRRPGPRADEQSHIIRSRGAADAANRGRIVDLQRATGASRAQSPIPATMREIRKKNPSFTVGQRVHFDGRNCTSGTVREALGRDYFEVLGDDGRNYTIRSTSLS